MSISSGSSQGVAAGPNVTPLIDILLVLLIIFMVITPMTSKGLESQIPTPRAAGAALSPTPPLVLAISWNSETRTVLYEFEHQTLTASSLQSVLLQARARASTNPNLFIAGDPHLDFQSVATVVSAAKVAGFPSIGLLPRPNQASQASH